MKTVTIRAMTAADLHQVVLLDWMSFSLPWPVRAFQHELQNPAARCWVAEIIAERALDYAAPLVLDYPPLTRQAGETAIVGALVLWMILDEAHIATLDVHPQLRRCGIARLLLSSALERALSEGARSSLLEVREGNLAARQLYSEFGYQIVGRRPHYYKDNGEDALLMTMTELGNIPALARRPEEK